MWHPITGRPSSAFPECHWTPAWELRVQHQRYDAVSGHPASPGCFIDRHTAPDRSLPRPNFTRDSIGWDQEPTGASLSLASAPGGALYVAGDGKTRFQRDWDFLRFHANRAIERRHMLRQAVPNHEDYLRGEDQASDWHRAEAIAAYAVQWKTRCVVMGESPHPVDVLLSSYHCEGSANICFALAMVLGIPARRISTSGHSTCELLIQGRWCWVDNIRSGVLLLPFSYQEFLAQVATWPCLNPGQRAHHAKAQAFYRAPYDYMPSLHWRLGGEVPSVGMTGDVAKGYGLSVHYDPATARALYPELVQYRFHADACTKPTLTIGNKGSWLHTVLTGASGVTLRRRLYVSGSPDNPIIAAEMRVWITEKTDIHALTLRLGGVTLACLGRREQRGCHWAAVFRVDPALLTQGWHEFRLTISGPTGTELVLFPDVVEPYVPPIDCAGIIIPANAVHTDSGIEPAPPQVDITH